MTLWMLAATEAWAQMPSAHPTNPGMDWQVPAAVLVAGLLVGFLVVSRLQGGDESVETASRRLDLASAKDEALVALRELETEKSKMDPAEYEAARHVLVARGARAMAMLAGDTTDASTETAGVQPDEDAVATTTFAEPRSATPPPAAALAKQPAAAPVGGLAPEWRGALYALVGVAVVGGLAWTLNRMSQERVGEMGMTGGEIVNSNNAVSPSDPKDNPSFKASVEMLEARLRLDEKDVDALNGLTQLYFTHADPSTAMEYNKQAIELAPKDNDARTYRAVLSAMMSMPDRATELLDEVLADSPEDPKAVTYKGLILMEQAKYPEAITVLEHAVLLLPGNEMINRALADARTRAAGGVPAGAGGPAPAAGAPIVSGTIQLAPGASVRGTETLFISVSDPSKPGPPIAADKLAAGPFPMAFALTTADIRAMPGAGATVPAVMTLKVRIDLDGNAMTKEPAPRAEITGVRKGHSGLQVTLSTDGTPTSAGPSAAPSDTGGARPAAAPASGVLVAGTATLGDGATLKPGQAVFISVRNPAGGPPVAADRIDGATFPLQFAITAEHILAMGGAAPSIPGQVVVTVRLDNDGNAMTKEGEPTATISEVRTGTADLALTLR